MFNELTINEQMNIDGGAITLLAIGKGLLIVGGLIFVAGAFKGCTDEAAK